MASLDMISIIRADHYWMGPMMALLKVALSWVASFIIFKIMMKMFPKVSNEGDKIRHHFTFD